MHEMTLLVGMMKQIDEIARQHNAEKVSVVRVKLGALSHISAEHFREHFEHAARGTVSEGAVLEVEELHDIDDPRAQDILLESVDVEERE